MPDPPYRAMRMPPRPRRALRPLVDRALAASNLAAFVSLTAFGISEATRAPVALGDVVFRERLGDVLLTHGAFSVPSVLGLCALLGHGPRRLREVFLLLSGALLLLEAAWFPLNALVIRGYAHRMHPPRDVGLAQPVALGVFFCSIGALSIESAFARSRRDRGTRS
jgi:hypothetical protein